MLRRSCNQTILLLETLHVPNCIKTQFYQLHNFNQFKLRPTLQISDFFAIADVRRVKGCCKILFEFQLNHKSEQPEAWHCLRWGVNPVVAKAFGVCYLKLLSSETTWKCLESNLVTCCHEQKSIRRLLTRVSLWHFFSAWKLYRDSLEVIWTCSFWMLRQCKRSKRELFDRNKGYNLQQW